MKKFLKKVTGLFGFTISRTVSSFNNPLAKFNINREDYEVRDDGYYLKCLDLLLKKNQQHGILMKGYNYAKNIARIAGGKFSFENENVVVEINKLKFKLDEFEELYILNEIFVERCYDIHTGEIDCVLVDIGMNVGFCSLYFAQKPEFKKIYSFEPFKETFELAKRNLELNSELGLKVKASNYGLAKRDGVLEVEYSVEARGRMGINGVPSDMINATREKRKLQLKDAATVLTPIFNENSDKCFVMKCDCEGAEFDIIDRLYEAGLLEKFCYCMIEWHYRSPQLLTSLLHQNSFATITTLFDNHNSGMIYAFRKISVPC